MRFAQLVLIAFLCGAALAALTVVPPAALAAPCLLPSSLPDTGGGGGSTCGGTLDGCGGAGGQADGGTSATFAYLGSAPGRPHASLLFLALPAKWDQAAGCGSQNSPGQAPPTNQSGRGGPGAPAAAPASCPPPPAAPALPDPRTVAQGLALPWPDLQIRAKPDNLGLTGLPTWFWIEGYTGGPVTASQHIHLDGLPNIQAGCPSGPGADEHVRVRAIPFAYDWHFGDHMPASSLATTSLGVPYPQREGAITHLYQTTSTGSGDPNGFAVVVNAHFRVQYQAGAGWQTLTEVSRQATMAYKVAQAYPVIVH